MDTTRCIWMDAEAVPYQLCPLNQNCDSCDFHKEMMAGCQGHFSRRNTALMTLREPDEVLIQFHPGLQYIPGHFWYKRTGAGKIQVGLDAFIWQILSTANQVLAPASNTYLAQNQCFSWLLINGGIVYLKTPFEGTVMETNPAFHSGAPLNPSLFLSPEPDLWLMELETSEEMIKSYDVYTKQGFIDQVSQDQTRLRQLSETPQEETSFSLSRISQLTKQDFAAYLRIIGDGRILIC
jgi:glycine cleavage system H lipoate-binding protein